MPSQIVRRVTMGKIDLREAQHREVIDLEGITELAESIRTLGLLNPVTLEKGKEGRYTLIAGRRRLTACAQLGWDTIPCIVVDLTGIDVEIARFDENLQRLNLNAVEEGKAIQQVLVEYDLTEQELADRLRKSVGWISQRVALVSGPEDVKDAVEKGDISFAVGRELSQVQNDEIRERLVSYAREGGATARVAKQWKEASHIEAQRADQEPQTERTSLEMGEQIVVKIVCISCRHETNAAEMKSIRLCPDCHQNFHIGLAEAHRENRNGEGIGR